MRQDGGMELLKCLRCNTGEALRNSDFIFCHNCANHLNYDRYYSYCQYCHILVKWARLDKSVNKWLCRKCFAKSVSIIPWVCPKCNKKYRREVDCQCIPTNTIYDRILKAKTRSITGIKFYYCRDCDGCFKELYQHPNDSQLYCPVCYRNKTLEG